ncbi:hypothetical protein DNU06_05280 [Putridiphycobacter roseus]|uniref:Spore coat protein CotH n=1 Tax=Putridiphycobacter roseus TaxID=2219161 RepID=A0A2W1N4M5_9FLAO|nr:CotH kinase family protein [Putridiphycobacter roseus]PZE18031.1 hypothetical protein DNU06_05280 [Putridiphycobacter roseus]
MKKEGLKINYSFVFLLVSMVLLLLLFPSIKNNFLAQKSDNLKQFQNLKDIVHLPSLSNNSIYSYDPNFKLTYSSDGGDHYYAFDTLRPEQIYFHNLYHYGLSQRSLPVENNLPKLPAVLIKGKQADQSIFIEESVQLFAIEKSHAVPVLNIIGSEQGLFSEGNGIMVMGIDSWFESGFYKPFWEKNANYTRRGQSSKRKVTFQWIKAGEVVYENACDFQISGNATRGFPQKSFKLKVNRAIGENIFKYKFFGKKGLKKYESLVIRSGGNDNTKTLFADALMHELAKNTHLLVQKSKACVVYINGNYWGIYNLRERIDPFFIAAYENSKPELISILEGAYGEVKSGKKKKQAEFSKLVESHHSYDKINDKIDIASFVDYILMETYYGNGDWLHNNAIWYQVGEGQWKWLLNDLDYGLTYTGTNNVNKNYFDAVLNSNTINAKLFKQLIEEKTFVALLNARGLELMETNFSDENIEKVFYKKMNGIYAEIPVHIKRWRGILNLDKWTENANNNLTFLLKRKEIFLSQLNLLNDSVL